MKGVRGIIVVLAAVLAGCTGDAPEIPPIPLRTGPLRPILVSPAPGEQLPGFGRYTVYGSVGDGRATLTINGAEIPVLPNGSFLARIPVPSTDSPAYEMVAMLGSDTAKVLVPVRVPPPGPRDGSGPLPRTSPTSPEPASVVLQSTGEGTADPTGLVTARSVPGGAMDWAFLPGTRVLATGSSGEFTRVRLDATHQVWVRTRDTRATDERVDMVKAAAPRVTPGAEWDEIAVPLREQVPFAVQLGSDGLEFTLYRTTVGRTSLVRSNGFVQEVVPAAAAADKAVYRVRTVTPAFGYAVVWREGEMVLRVRRPPPARVRAPLRGLVIAIDAGHPPAGATGPTGVEEHAVTLAVAEQLERILRAGGARVVMTRTDAAPVSLGSRIQAAEAAGAHALVSIHVDSRPGHVDPRVASGSRTYFFHPHSAHLASTVQRALARRLALGDRGVHRNDLALVRPTSMPAVLCEGAMLILPEHEHALQTPAVRRAYAQGIAEGLERYFRELALRRN